MNNGEQLKTKTLETSANLTDTQPAPVVDDIDTEWKKMSGELEAPRDQSLSGKDLFTKPEELSHPHGEGYETDITTRLAAEPLAEDKKQDLLVKSLSDSAKDVAEYGKERAAMTPEHQREFDEHREYAVLSGMQRTNPDAFNAEVAKLPVERRAAFYDYAKAEAKANQEKLLESASRSESDEDRRSLYSLKLSNPGQFEEIFQRLTPEQKGLFDTFELEEDAKLKKDSPDMAIPRLSGSGDSWNIKGELPPDSQAHYTPEQLQAAGIEQNKKDKEFIDSVSVVQKPRGWAKVKSWFSRKPKLKQ